MSWFWRKGGRRFLWTNNNQLGCHAAKGMQRRKKAQLLILEKAQTPDNRALMSLSTKEKARGCCQWVVHICDYILVSSQVGTEMFKSKETSSIVHSRSASVIVRWKTHCPKGQSPITGSGTSRSEPRWPIFPYDPRSSHTIGHQTALTSLNPCIRDLLLRKWSLSGQGLANNHQFLYWRYVFPSQYQPEKATSTARSRHTGDSACLGTAAPSLQLPAWAHLLLFCHVSLLLLLPGVSLSQVMIFVFLL